MGIFVRYFLWQGGFILFSLHMTMAWDLANGTGIPASSESRCLRKQTTRSE